MVRVGVRVRVRVWVRGVKHGLIGKDQIKDAKRNRCTHKAVLRFVHSSIH